ncbi:hypothetical protein HPS54_10070 [Prevotella sp. PCHR]|uniref:Anti sigma-E protein RseA N-terminal domain-containing protein n=1 Tax=Xylanibacter caecicola TaxID=2736294 RepID=A0ABX2B328_9BACT|nr:hypothetical protein [Xylanibacter caecicola]NPE25857.1 hypothetical protein [Xylanibacter caecicola]
MNKDRKYIENLIEKYLDGDTSNNEEKLLRRYFTNSGNDIPDEWKALRALFGYETVQRKNALRNTRTGAIRIYIRYAAVASAVILIAIPIMMHRNGTSGNYAVIDGKVCTDSRIVTSEAEKALMMVAIGEDETFEALGQIQ